MMGIARPDWQVVTALHVLRMVLGAVFRTHLGHARTSRTLRCLQAKRGRWRSNVWTYPGASSLGSDARRGLKDHPTVKPTAMLEDALLDLSNRSDVVIDPFLGSGSTLIAADKTGRVCRGVELDPLYVDVIVRRYEAATGGPAVLVGTGEVFDLLAKRRSREAAPA
jgi:hypothetical protein